VANITKKDQRLLKIDAIQNRHLRQFQGYKWIITHNTKIVMTSKMANLSDQIEACFTRFTPPSPENPHKDHLEFLVSQEMNRNVFERGNTPDGLV